VHVSISSMRTRDVCKRRAMIIHLKAVRVTIYSQDVCSSIDYHQSALTIGLVVLQDPVSLLDSLKKQKALLAGQGT